MKTLFTVLFNLVSLPLLGFLVVVIWNYAKEHGFLSGLGMFFAGVGVLVTVGGVIANGELHFSYFFLYGGACYVFKFILSSTGSGSDRSKPKTIETRHEKIDLSSFGWRENCFGDYENEYTGRKLMHSGYGKYRLDDDYDESGYSESLGEYTITY